TPRRDRERRATHSAPVFTIAWIGVHVAVDSVFTIPWKLCSRSRGIRSGTSRLSLQAPFPGSQYF
ncbi:MAG TPA: hypothetical protein VJA94_13230, partial [Candidatus Angelobacter sp.]